MQLWNWQQFGLRHQNLVKVLKYNFINIEYSIWNIKHLPRGSFDCGFMSWDELSKSVCLTVSSSNFINSTSMETLSRSLIFSEKFWEALYFSILMSELIYCLLILIGLWTSKLAILFDSRSTASFDWVTRACNWAVETTAAWPTPLASLNWLKIKWKW